MELTEKEKKAAQAFARMGGLKGGKARAQALTAEERSESARQAAEARWAKQKRDKIGENLPKAEYTGTLQIGDIEFPCAVLDDNTRVLTQSGFLVALGRHKNPTRGQAAVDNRPSFLAARNLNPFIPNELSRSWTPLRFESKGGGGYGGNIAFGYRAELLPQVCNVFIDAYNAKKLVPSQYHIAEKCRILNRGFSTVGIIALIDEATGYQSIRPQDALQAYLELIIRKELAAWVKKFPDDFYINIYKLKGWVWPGMQKNRYSIVAHYTNDLVYERVAPGLLEELQRKSPKNERGYRKNKLHDWLTDDIGNPLLAQHLHTLMKFQELAIANGYSWNKYVKMVDQVMPKRGGNLELPLLDQTSELG